MITKFKIFENIDHSDIDPYGEENWGNFNNILKIGDKIVNTHFPEHYGEVIEIDGDIITLSADEKIRINVWTVAIDEILNWVNDKTCYIDSVNK